jgi:hypothetical protein
VVDDAVFPVDSTSAVSGYSRMGCAGLGSAPGMGGSAVAAAGAPGATSGDVGDNEPSFLDFFFCGAGFLFPLVVVLMAGSFPSFPSSFPLTGAFGGTDRGLWRDTGAFAVQ